MHVEIRELSKSYWLSRVLDKIDLTLQSGKIMAVLGVNGAGKSTLLRCLATLLVPDHGQIMIDGEVLTRSRLDLRRRLHLVADMPSRAGNIDIATQIAFVLRSYGHQPPGIETTVAELLAEFGLGGCEYKTLGSLSRGQLYKASLVTLVALDRELWLVDEPFGSGIDPRGLTAFRRHSRAAAKRGRTIIYTTQILEMVATFADCIGTLSDGRLKVFQSMDEFRSAGGGDADWQQILNEYGDSALGGD
jgi:ABC-2 type transport system ATP-binding protein